MAKKVTVEVEVNSSQVDQTVQKLGQLKDLGRGLKIQYDIDGRPIDVVLDKSLNLQKQVKILTAELRRTKEGTAEFQMLSRRLGEAQDGLAKTTAKSKDLFSTLSMLPGPVGQFFSQLQGGIELLKTFSSFTFKDLSFQFSETADDIADIGKNLSGVNGDAIDAVGNSAEAASNSVGDFSNSLAEVAAQSAGASSANNELSDTITTQQKNLQELAREARRTGVDTEEYANAVANATDEGIEFISAEENMTQASKASGQAVAGQAVATEGLVVAEKQATFWTSTLGTTIKTVLISTGVLIAIVAIGELISFLYKFVDAEAAAEEATKKLNKELENQNTLLDLDTKSLKRRNDELIASMKARGASEGEIRTQMLKNAYEEYTSAYNAEVQARKTYNENISKVDAEGVKTLNKNLLDREEATKNAYSSYKILGLNQKAEELKIQNDKNKELENKNKEHLKKIEEDTKTANDLLLKLLQENAVQRLDTERKREDLQLKNEKINEEKSINNLKISEELRGKLLEQVRYKYGLKIIELNKKRQAEDNKTFEEEQQKVKEYNDKIFEIMNNADENELSRNKYTRTRKFEDDKAALEKDLNFQKETLENKIRILMALEKAYKNDLEKLDNDENQKNRESKLKKLDDELRFLQIRGEAVVKGTREYFNNLRTISKKAEERELQDLDNRAITEKLTAEQVEREKTEIKKKYANERKQIDRQELDSYLQIANQILGAAQNVLSQELAIRGINQQNKLDELQIEFNKQQEYNAKTMSSKEEFDKQTVKNERELAVKQDKIKEQYFNRNKDAQYAQALISASQAAIAAYSAMAAIPVVGPALGIAAAALALGYGIAQANAIKRQKYVSGVAAQFPDSSSSSGSSNMGKNYEKGGMIGGKRHAEGGTLIEAEKGEAIMTRGAVTMFAPLLSAMNQMGGGTSFAPSLMTTSYDAPNTLKPSQEQAPMIVKTYVVSSELTSEQNKQARLKDLSTL